MFRNAAVTLCALWFFLAPTLCAAGALTHACDCSSLLGCETFCEEEEQACDCVQHRCSHDGCANDPCQVPVVVQKDRSEDLHSTNHGTLAGPSSFLEWESAFLRVRPAGNSGEPGAGKNLSCFPSDIPLLA